MIDINVLCKTLLEDTDAGKYMYGLTFVRHLKDIKKFKNNKRFRFNNELANKYIAVIESLTHVKGKLANKNLLLEDWQKALIMIASGWEYKNEDNEWVRRFNDLYIFISRKNGKSLFASAFAIADSILRPERGGEVKIAATKKEQAQIVYDDVVGQMKQSQELCKLYKTAKGVLTFNPTNTTFSTLGNESTATKEDGFSSTIGVVDEYSAHSTRALYDIIKSSQGARLQPLMMMITTAGFHLGSPSVAEHEYSKKILLGTLEDEHYFAFLASPYDIKGKSFDKFSDEALYATNPNIGVSVSKDFLVKERKKAQANPEALVSYLTKHENRFVAQSEVFIQLEDWKKNARNKEPDYMEATHKILGVDMSITDDFTALAILYKFSDDDYFLKTKFYIPQDNVSSRSKQLRVPLEAWVEEGHIITTPGNFIDYDYIYNDIKEELSVNSEKEDYNLNIDLRYDPYKFKELVKKIENDLGFTDINATRQGYLTLSEPTKLLLDLTKSGKMKHNNNPAMNWMISNFAILTDPAGNIKPDKSDRNRKIDGVAATVNCLDGAIPIMGEEEISEVIWV